MKLSKEGSRLARELFELSRADGRLDNARINQVVDHLVAQKPREYIQVLREFTRLVRLELEKHHAVIESAVELESGALARIERGIRKRFGAALTTEFRVNPDLIGGLRVKIGNDVWDGSIRSRLQLLKEEI